MTGTTVEVKVPISGSIKDVIKKEAAKQGVTMESVYNRCIELAASKIRAGEPLLVESTTKHNRARVTMASEDYEAMMELAKKLELGKSAVITRVITATYREVINEV